MHITQELVTALPAIQITREVVTTPSATRIPQELFSHVIFYLLPEFRLKKRDKRDLGQLSLVCRYWASKTRGRIFANLTLRSRDDALEFTSFAKCSIWPVHSIVSIGKYVKSLRFFVDVLDLPWIHLILHCMPNDILGPTSDSPIEVHLNFACLAPGGGQGTTLASVPRHVYHDLPRRFPPTMRPRFTQPSVWIRKLSFGSPKNLTYFVFSAHRHLKYLNCERVAFTDVNTLWSDNFNGSDRQRGTVWESLSIDRCTDALMLINIILIRRVCAMSSPPLDYAQTRHNMASELAAISTVLRSFGEVRRMTVIGMPNGVWHEIKVSFDKGQHYYNINCCTIQK